MATLTKGITFASGDVVTPAKLNNLVDQATVSNIQTADIADSQITTSKIADANVTTAKIADANVTTAKIADAAITSAKLASGAIPAAIPAGAVMPFAMNSAPSGWLAANGAEVSRTTYAGLFTAIGTTYGIGNGSTTFNLPDLRGYFVRGSGTNSDGTAAGTFGQKQSDEFKSHSHGYNYRVDTVYGAVWPNSGFGGGSTSRTTTQTGGTETRPKNIALLYCIKF